MNIGERQRKLSLWAEQLRTEPEQGLFASRKDLRLFDLYHLVYEPTWLLAAHDRVARNTGSVTAGCDGINMAKFDANLESNLQKLAEDFAGRPFGRFPFGGCTFPRRTASCVPWASLRSGTGLCKSPCG
jgi:RNA-directed DNA polymerase